MTQRLTEFPLTDKDIESLIRLFEKQQKELKAELAERKSQRVIDVIGEPLEVGSVRIDYAN